MKISLYIHIPFCIKKCLYCDFLSGPYDDKVRFSYVEALVNELRFKANIYSGYEVVSIFIGGGTPSILTNDQIMKIMDTIYDCYLISDDAEITMEVNPGTVSAKDQVLGYKEANINRVSIGLQSALDSELKLLGRIHSVNDFENTYGLFVDAGFKNLNVDLISGLPNQKCEDFSQSLRYVTTLGDEIKHISAYGLIIEEGTPFYEKYGENKEPIESINEDVDRKIYKITQDMLSAAGFVQYEISNYSKNGYDCKHNIRYWRRENYIGFGIGAASLFNNVRWSNTSDINKYILNNGICEEEELIKLSVNDQMEEFMFLGLRMKDGVSVRDFYSYFKQDMPDKYMNIIDKYINMSMLKRNKDRIMLTDEGINVSNTIMSEFLF